MLKLLKSLNEGFEGMRSAIQVGGAAQPAAAAGGLDDVDQLIVAALKAAPDGLTTPQLALELAKAGRKVSQPTLSRRLARLAMGRHVISDRPGRAARHRRDPYHDWFDVPPGKRPKVGYRPELLDGYRPNQTAWFSPEELAKLRSAGGNRHLDGSTYARAIAQKLLVDLSYASSALEGNTYTYLDTQVLIEFGKEAEGKEAEETLMILNHKEAILYLVQNIGEIEVDVREIKSLHALLARGLMRDETSVGAVRRRVVDITGSAYIPTANPHVLEQELARVAATASAIEEPFEQSLFLMAFISYLQAFEDVNKRTARLACNIPLLKAGIAPLSFLEMDKTAYVRGLVAFYELGRPDILKDAYIEGYVKSAARYDAYASRDKAAIELEVRRRNDIYGAVRAYVAYSVSEGGRQDPQDFALVHFGDEPEATRRALAARVAEIVASLHEGNHIGYGVPRKLFDEYAGLAESKADRPSA